MSSNIIFQITLDHDTGKKLSHGYGFSHKIFGSRSYAEIAQGVGDDLFVNAANDGFTLPAGKYIIEVSGSIAPYGFMNTGGYTLLHYSLNPVITVDRTEDKTFSFCGGKVAGTSRGVDFLLVSGVLDIQSQEEKIFYECIPEVSTNPNTPLLSSMEITKMRCRILGIENAPAL